MTDEKKTAEEKAEAYIISRDIRQYQSDEIRKAYLAGYQAAKEAGWISVKDRLPEVDEVVLVYPGTCLPVTLGTRRKVGWQDLYDYSEPWSGPAHWRSLPEPPKEKEE